MVLGGGPHHRRTADVDLLHALRHRGAGGDRLAERVQVADHQPERLDLEVGQLREVRRVVGVREDCGVHRWVQRLDAAVQALGEPGDVLDRRHRDARGSDARGARAG